MTLKHINLYCSAAVVMLLASGCSKFTDVGAPKNGLSTAQVFSSDASANSAIAGIYYTFSNSVIGNGSLTTYAGMSADEADRNYPSASILQLVNNALTAENSSTEEIWTGVFNIVAKANSCMEGLEISANVSEDAKKRFSAEARFLRAYCNFYLVNLFGDVPLITTANWTSTMNVKRSSKDSVYSFIISDLKAAAENLPPDYSSGKNIRATQKAANAMLAKVMLYRKQWAEAIRYARLVIDEMNVPLPPPEAVFLMGSSEAIWQLQPTGTAVNPNEGSLWYVAAWGTINCFLRPGVVNAFEAGDLRKTAWIDSVDNGGTMQYYPKKYKTQPYTGPASEYYTMLRLAEIYLIKAEAHAGLEELDAAIANLNVVRQRAGIDPLPVTADKNVVAAAVEKERRTELVAELGNRWMDLIRTGRAVSVMGALKPGFTKEDQLYPVPASDIRKNKNLLPQNPGYNN